MLLERKAVLIIYYVLIAPYWLLIWKEAHQYTGMAFDLRWKFQSSSLSPVLIDRKQGTHQIEFIIVVLFGEASQVSSGCLGWEEHHPQGYLANKAGDEA